MSFDIEMTNNSYITPSLIFSQYRGPSHLVWAHLVSFEALPDTTVLGEKSVCFGVFTRITYFCYSHFAAISISKALSTQALDYLVDGLNTCIESAPQHPPNPSDTFYIHFVSTAESVRSGSLHLTSEAMFS